MTRGGGANGRRYNNALRLCVYNPTSLCIQDLKFDVWTATFIETSSGNFLWKQTLQNLWAVSCPYDNSSVAASPEIKWNPHLTVCVVRCEAFVAINDALRVIIHRLITGASAKGQRGQTDRHVRGKRGNTAFHKVVVTSKVFRAATLEQRCYWLLRDTGWPTTVKTKEWTIPIGIQAEPVIVFTCLRSFASNFSRSFALPPPALTAIVSSFRRSK